MQVCRNEKILDEGVGSTNYEILSATIVAEEEDFSFQIV